MSNDGKPAEENQNYLRIGKAAEVTGELSEPFVITKRKDYYHRQVVLKVDFAYIHLTILKGL